MGDSLPKISVGFFRLLIKNFRLRYNRQDLDPRPVLNIILKEAKRNPKNFINAFKTSDISDRLVRISIYQRSRRLMSVKNLYISQILYLWLTKELTPHKIICLMSKTNFDIEKIPHIKLESVDFKKSLTRNIWEFCPDINDWFPSMLNDPLMIIRSSQGEFAEILPGYSIFEDIYLDWSGQEDYSNYLKIIQDGLTTIPDSELIPIIRKFGCQNRRESIFHGLLDTPIHQKNKKYILLINEQIRYQISIDDLIDELIFANNSLVVNHISIEQLGNLIKWLYSGQSSFWTINNNSFTIIEIST